MQKLKKVFSPGNDKDDETMYGSAATRKANAESGSAAGHTSTSPTTATTSDGKDHAISRQILNPGGDKYDEVRFGAPAGADTRTGDLKQDPSVKRQVFGSEQ